MAGYVHLAASEIRCEARRTPRIEVGASDTRVRYDHTKSQAEMDRLENNSLNPYGKNVEAHVGGLMAGEVSISQNIRIYQETWPGLNRGCLYYDSIKVDLHIKPVIYIAREYDKNGCMYKSILEHEKKHIEVDRTIVNKYTKIITKSLNDALKKMGIAHGPFPAKELKFHQETLQTFIQDTVKKYSSAMSEERQDLQRKVDTLEEYEAVQAKCRGKR